MAEIIQAALASGSEGPPCAAVAASAAGLSRLEGSVCAFGVFDGLHRGHEVIVDRAVLLSREQGVPAIALTFDVDPDDVLDPEHVKLMSDEDRLGKLSESGFDLVVAFRFDGQFASMEPGEFLDAAFSCNLPSTIVVGEDFRFGHRGVGDVVVLRDWGCANGVRIVEVPLFEEGGSAIKSTRIRELLAEGNVEEAAKLLGHPYAISGTVVKGRSQGREMGIRTANLEVPEKELACREGVYAGFVDVDGRKYKAAVSCGVSPTFRDTAKANVEAHILDFDGDLYGRKITVELAKFIQQLRTFDSVDELKTAIEGYIGIARSL